MAGMTKNTFGLDHFIRTLNVPLLVSREVKGRTVKELVKFFRDIRSGLDSESEKKLDWAWKISSKGGNRG